VINLLEYICVSPRNGTRIRLQSHRQDASSSANSKDRAIFRGCHASGQSQQLSQGCLYKLLAASWSAFGFLAIILHKSGSSPTARKPASLPTLRIEPVFEAAMHHDKANNSAKAAFISFSQSPRACVRLFPRQ